MHARTIDGAFDACSINASVAYSMLYYVLVRNPDQFWCIIASAASQLSDNTCEAQAAGTV